MVKLNFGSFHSLDSIPQPSARRYCLKPLLASAPKIDLRILYARPCPTTSRTTTLTLAFVEPIPALPRIKSSQRKGIHISSCFGLNPKPKLGEDQFGWQASAGPISPPLHISFQKHRAHPSQLRWFNGSIDMPYRFAPCNAHPILQIQLPLSTVNWLHLLEPAGTFMPLSDRAAVALFDWMCPGLCRATLEEFTLSLAASRVGGSPGL